MQHNSKLQVLDLNGNRLARIENVQHLSGLTDFWARNNRFAVWDDVLSQLAGLRDLRLVYLELNPLAKNDQYRQKLMAALPQVTRIDAVPCRWMPGDPWQSMPKL